MLVTAVEDEMCCWQFWNIGDGFGRFGHQYPPSFYISVGHQQSKDVINTQKLSSTLSHQHPFVTNIHVAASLQHLLLLKKLKLEQRMDSLWCLLWKILAQKPISIATEILNSRNWSIDANRHCFGDARSLVANRTLKQTLADVTFRVLSLSLFCPYFPENRVRCLSVCLDFVSCPDSFRI